MEINNCTCVEQFSVAVCVMMTRVDGNTRGVSGFSGGCAIHSLRDINLNGPSGFVIISLTENNANEIDIKHMSAAVIR